MKLLMSPAEVEAAAFGDMGGQNGALVSESAVYAAQCKFIKPVLGPKMSAALEEGSYAEFAEEYVKPALAMFVKYAVLPSVAARAGALGVVNFSGECFDAADNEAVRRLRDAVRSDAEALLAAAVGHIEASSGEYPEYDPRENIKNRVSIGGGIVL